MEMRCVRRMRYKNISQQPLIVKNITIHPGEEKDVDFRIVSKRVIVVPSPPTPPPVTAKPQNSIKPEPIPTPVKEEKKPKAKPSKVSDDTLINPKEGLNNGEDSN
jgi:hypothetical protein